MLTRANAAVAFFVVCLRARANADAAANIRADERCCGSVRGARARLRSLIDASAFDEPMDAGSVAVVNELTGWSFEAYKRVRNRAFPSDTRCLAHLSAGEWEVWSWNKAIAIAAAAEPKGWSPGSVEWQAALRWEVRDQMAEYALKALDECARCGKRSDMTVDHLTVAFSTLANQFAASVGACGPPGPSVPSGQLQPALLANDATGRGWYVKDASVAARWREFHRANADYQMLCRSCNSRKGSKRMQWHGGPMKPSDPVQP